MFGNGEKKLLSSSMHFVTFLFRQNGLEGLTLSMCLHLSSIGLHGSFGITCSKLLFMNGNRDFLFSFRGEVEWKLIDYLNSGTWDIIFLVEILRPNFFSLCIMRGLSLIFGRPGDVELNSLKLQSSSSSNEPGMNWEPLNLDLEVTSKRDMSSSSVIIS